MSSSFPIPDPKTPEGREARDLFDRAQRHAEAADAIRCEAYDAQAEVDRLEAELEVALRDAAVSGTKAAKNAAADLESKLTLARQQAADPFEVRGRAARRAAADLRGQYARHVNENLDALLSEFAPDAEAAKARVGAAIAEVEAAVREWSEVASRVTSLIVNADHLNGQALPPFDGGAAVRSLRATLRDVPLPMPREHAIARRADLLNPQPPVAEDEGQEAA